MRLNVDECLERLRDSEHGVLATVHAKRGVDAVPVVFVLFGVKILIPVDTVKQKTTTRLQRLANIERDHRCVLLVDEYDRDWSKLWWVRVHAAATIRDSKLAPAFEHFEQYRAPGSIDSIIELHPTSITGWSS